MKPRDIPQSKSRAEQAVRLAYMTDVLGRTAQPAEVGNLDSPTIADIIKTQAQLIDIPAAALDGKTPVKRDNSLVVGTAVTTMLMPHMEVYQSYAAAAYCLNGLPTWSCQERCDGVTSGTIFVSQFQNEDSAVGYIAYHPTTKNIAA
ncbi:hypothetical protein HKX48_007961 [Thoreauomyces humboldtii]|nr:hypothetical protein HKX48_007961 [Thoreauomyces humboldtii]